MTNKHIRLAQIVQDDFPEKLVEAFKSTDKPTLNARIELVNRAIAAHQARAEALYLQAGKQRTIDERRASARAELAAFLFACLTGEAKEHTDSAIAAMQALGRHGEIDLIRSLARS